MANLELMTSSYIPMSCSESSRSHHPQYRCPRYTDCSYDFPSSNAGSGLRYPLHASVETPLWCNSEEDCRRMSDTISRFGDQMHPLPLLKGQSFYLQGSNKNRR